MKTLFLKKFLLLLCFAFSITLISCDSNHEYDYGAQNDIRSVQLTESNFESYANIEVGILRLDRNTVYLENYLEFGSLVDSYRNLNVSVFVTYIFTYRLSDGSYGKDSRSAMASFNNNQICKNNVYFSLNYSIVEINLTSIRYNVVNASGEIIFS